MGGILLLGLDGLIGRSSVIVGEGLVVPVGGHDGGGLRGTGAEMEMEMELGMRGKLNPKS